MPLRAHLRELRSRVLKAGLAVALGSVLGWFLYQPLFQALQSPIEQIARERPGSFSTISFTTVGSAFDLQLKLSVYIGLVVASPVWLYQLWAFIVPGLTRREKRHALAFVAAAVPLFLAGIFLAWLVLPNAVRFLTEFTPEGAANIISAGDYLSFVTRVMLAFGIAFVIPLLLVALNLLGVLSAVSMAKGWRVAVFLTFLFAAIASPTPDAGSMLALAFPMVGLYMIAVGIAWFVDRRRARANPYAELDDDEASPLGPDDVDSGFDPDVDPEGPRRVDDPSSL
jgi:sec-independent protein translocase protein TatC